MTVKVYPTPCPTLPGRTSSGFDPARVLAECEAKRRIVALHDGAHECSVYVRGEVDNCAWVERGDSCSTLRLLALPYADHPDYDPSWAV